jgi:hypothetical protein
MSHVSLAAELYHSFAEGRIYWPYMCLSLASEPMSLLLFSLSLFRVGPYYEPDFDWGTWEIKG